MNTPLSHCRSCGADIWWLTNARTGKKSPIDATPHAGGNIMVHLDTNSCDIATPVYRREHPEEPFYLNHFATCPDAKKWKSHGSRNETEVAS